MLTFKEMLEVENTPEILKFVCPGTDYLLWPSVRILVNLMIQEQEIYSEGTLIKSERLKNGDYFRILKCFADGFIHNLRFLRYKSKIVFFDIPGFTNININSMYFNRICDSFVFCYPKSSLVIENHYNWLHFRPRVNRNVAYDIPFWLLAQISAKLPFNKVDDKPIRLFVKFIDSQLKSTIKFNLTEQQQEVLYEALSRFCARIKTELCIYRALYKKLNPKLIFFHCGCYGWHGHLIRLAKEMGISTAEMQHGRITKSHIAYNYGPVILNSDIYRTYIPDYFLAYGQWWADQISIPSDVVVIGNPYNEKMRYNHITNIEKRIKVLLFSDNLNFDRYLNLAHILKSTILKDDDIMIRPHPLEKKLIIKKYGLDVKGILIDDSDDLYGRIAESNTVIGANTTALFESIGLAEKIFSIITPVSSFEIPDTPFDQFETVDQLIVMLSDDSRGKINQNIAESIWANNWEANYRDFIEHRIGLNLD